MSYKGIIESLMIGLAKTSQVIQSSPWQGTRSFSALGPLGLLSNLVLNNFNKRLSGTPT